MKTWELASLLVVLVLGFGANGYLQQRTPTWDYLIEPVADGMFDGRMASLGADGWELVFARRASSGRFGDDDSEMLYECIFKRAREPGRALRLSLSGATVVDGDREVPRMRR